MDKSAITEYIMDTINEITDIDKSDMEPDSAVIDDLDMDSLEIMSMISRLEREYSMKFITRDLRAIITISDIADYIISKC